MATGYGTHYGKTDMERIGLFAEMEYLHGKGYTSPSMGTDVRDLKGSQMYPGVAKIKTGLQDCYFDKKFKRAFEKEGWSTPFTRELKERLELKKSAPQRPTYMPPPYPKKHACPGDYYGTIGGPVKAFSPVLKPVERKGIQPPNVITNPGKKGGPGYANICLNKYPTHKGGNYDDPFAGANDPKRKFTRPTPFLAGFHGNYFDKNPYYETKIAPVYKKEFTKFEPRSGPFYPPPSNKQLGGCKAGCFDKWPKYQSSPYNPPKDSKDSDKKGQNEPKGIFRPQPRIKTMYTTSVMQNKVDIAINTKNYKQFKPITFTREFLV